MSNYWNPGKSMRVMSQQLFSFVDEYWYYLISYVFYRRFVMASVFLLLKLSIKDVFPIPLLPTNKMFNLVVLFSPFLSFPSWFLLEFEFCFWISDILSWPSGCEMKSSSMLTVSESTIYVPKSGCFLFSLSVYPGNFILLLISTALKSSYF